MVLWSSEAKIAVPTVPSKNQQARESTPGFWDWQACDQAQLYLMCQLTASGTPGNWQTIGGNVEQRLEGDVPLPVWFREPSAFRGPRKDGPAHICRHYWQWVNLHVREATGRTWLTTATDHTGECSWSQHYFSLHKCSEELCNILGSTNSKTHVTKENLFFTFISTPWIYLRQWNPYVPASFICNSLKWCSVQAFACPQNLLFPFYEHFEAVASRIWEPAKPELSRTQLGLKFKTPKALLDIICG